jgi:eukaryotic-like serine/threonine-protein kinase
MGEPQRRCSSCGESYAEGVLFCPRDGSALSLRAADAGPDPHLGQTLANAYRVDALVGTGAVGRVYRAQQLGVERPVAIKIMHLDLVANDALRRRFQGEARLAGSLNHPNVVNVLAVAELKQERERIPVPFLVLEYLDGMSLRSALSACGTLPAKRVLHILLQIADAVGEAHQRGIVHRDLKPENVMLVQRGDDPDFVKVLDFGVARAEDADPALATRAGSIFGSARYVAPECAAGGSSSTASDVYALATIAYECLSGRTPFDGQSVIQILLKQQSEAVPPLHGANIPPGLARFIEANLAKIPAARASDGRSFARELVLAARDSGLDPGLSSRTRRGHGVTLAQHVIPSRAIVVERFELKPSVAPSAAHRALFVLLCFVIGAGAALSIAARLGAFAGGAR